MFKKVRTEFYPVVPKVTGLTPFSAANTLGLYGLMPSVPLTHTNRCPGADVGLIVSSSPPAGLREPFGTPVSLTVCDLTPVPSVLSFDDASARSTIIAAGLTVGSVTMTASCIMPAGDVLTQNPSAGAQVIQGTPVNLTESTGMKANGQPCIIE